MQCVLLLLLLQLLLRPQMTPMTAPGTMHGWHAPATYPLGFFCLPLHFLGARLDYLQGALRRLQSNFVQKITRPDSPFLCFRQVKREILTQTR